MKRLPDIIISILGLIITFPILLLSIIAIKCTSKGSVLYCQKRIGYRNKIFILLKLRTMINGKDKDRTHAGKKDDPRITKVGKKIRMFRVDEIPQMWNVIRGDMNLIGPRSLIEEEVKEFNKHIPNFNLRHDVYPGITGLAQVNYKHGVTVEDAREKLKYDLYYIDNKSLLLDIKILIKTVYVVLSGIGAR